MKKVYIAGTIEDRQIPDIIAELKRMGYEIVSHWHDPGAWMGESRRQELADRRALANKNRADLDQADVVVVSTNESSAVQIPLRGAHYEIGYAQGRGIPVFILGSHRVFNTMTAGDGSYYGDLRDMDRFLTTGVAP